MAAFLRLMILAFFFSGLAAQSISATIAWDASPSSDIDGYHLYRRTGTSGNFQRLTVSPTTLRTYTDSTAAYGQLYYYAATAIRDSGLESDFSESVLLDLICRGDTNTDRQRNVLDVVQIQNHIVGNLLLQNNALIAGDVDGNSQVSVLDAVRLLNHVVGNNPLPTCVQ